jgi:hypothetical protein
MSQQNIDVTRALYDRWNSGDRPDSAWYCDPTVELDSPFASVVGEPYRGLHLDPDHVRHRLQEIADEDCEPDRGRERWERLPIDVVGKDRPEGLLAWPMVSAHVWYSASAGWVDGRLDG